MSKTRKFWISELKAALTTSEYNELNREMNKLLRRDEPRLSAYDELLAYYGLEPDYLLAWIG